MALTATQQTTFIEALPRTSLCADNYKFGSHIRNKTHAIKHQHIELNNDKVFKFISLDIDYPVSEDMCFVWESKNLPEPTYAVINPANNHAHLLIQMETPVFANNEKQLAYFNDVKSILIDIYNADTNFTGQLTKNPLHDSWKTISSGKTYTLDELKAYAPVQAARSKLIRFNKYKRRTLDQNNADLGHRCLIFETSRIIAYNEVRNFNDPTDFFNYMIGVCNDQNPSDLKYSDILSTAKSISRYTWKNRERYSKGYIRNRVSSIEELRERQRKAATSTAGTRHAKTLAAIESAIKSLLTNAVAMPAISKQAIAKLAGKSLATIKRYAHDIDRLIRCVYQVLSPVSSVQTNLEDRKPLAQLNVPAGDTTSNVDTNTFPATRSPFLSDICKPLFPQHPDCDNQLSESHPQQHSKSSSIFKFKNNSPDPQPINPDIGTAGKGREARTNLDDILEIIEQMKQASKTVKNSS